MSAANPEMDPDVRQVADLLQARFSEVDCYRHNSVSIRARIRDEQFRGKSLSEREAVIEPVLEQLPAKIRDQLILVLLLPPAGPRSDTEQLLNAEFEKPEPDQF